LAQCDRPKEVRPANEADNRFGYDSAYVGTTIARSSFVRDFGITSATKSAISSNITSAFQAGAFFGALFCFFRQCLGR
jgi:hypothetical protein